MGLLTSIFKMNFYLRKIQILYNVLYLSATVLVCCQPNNPMDKRIFDSKSVFIQENEREWSIHLRQADSSGFCKLLLLSDKNVLTDSMILQTDCVSEFKQYDNEHVAVSYRIVPSSLLEINELIVGVRNQKLTCQMEFSSSTYSSYTDHTKHPDTLYWLEKDFSNFSIVERDLYGYDAILYGLKDFRITNGRGQVIERDSAHFSSIFYLDSITGQYYTERKRPVVIPDNLSIPADSLLLFREGKYFWNGQWMFLN